MTNSLSKSGVGARDACAYKNAFTAIGWKHPRDWMWPFARHIPHSSEKKRLKDQSWKWFVLEKKKTRMNLLLFTILWFGTQNSISRAFKVCRTIICFSGWVVVKLFVTRFHCVCPDYRYIVCSTETGTFGVKMIFGQHRFENSHSNSGLKEKSEGAVEMADSILRYFSQRLLSLSSAILKWNQGRKNTAAVFSSGQKARIGWRLKGGY